MSTCSRGRARQQPCDVSNGGGFAIGAVGADIGNRVEIAGSGRDAGKGADAYANRPSPYERNFSNNWLSSEGECADGAD